MQQYVLHIDSNQKPTGCHLFTTSEKPPCQDQMNHGIDLEKAMKILIYDVGSLFYGLQSESYIPCKPTTYPSSASLHAIPATTWE